MDTEYRLERRLESLPDCYEGFVDSAMNMLIYHDLTDETLAMLENTPDATTETVLWFMLFMTGREPQ